jgi:hypothetical protein
MLCFIRELLTESAKVIYADLFGAMRDGLAIVAPAEEESRGISAPNHSTKVSEALELGERIHGTFYHVFESNSVQSL